MATRKPTSATVRKMKIQFLSPIVERWNNIHDDTWVVEPDTFSTKIGSVNIYRKNPQDTYSYSLHGCLAADIAGICEAMDWCWAIYFERDRNGIVVRI